MDRYQKTFAELKKKERAGFCPFAVLGHPTPRESVVRIKKYLSAGADFLELGIPFSDPVADGPIIQAANLQALNAGTTPQLCLKLISRIRKLADTAETAGTADSTDTKLNHGKAQSRSIPIGILTYSNIVLKYGIAKFYRDLKKAGADSILIADVPLEEIEPFVRAANNNNLHQIFTVSENSTPLRIKQIGKYASGFLYVVSTLGITGIRKTLNPKIHALLTRLRKSSKLPLVIGFGISLPSQIRQLSKSKPQGIIVGSALVNKTTNNLQEFASELQKSIII